MGKRVLLFAKRGDAAARAELQSLSKTLESSGCEFIDATDIDRPLTAAELDRVVLGVAFGGDGTFLTLFRRLERKDQFPLLGVNLGTLGFITETNKDEVASMTERVLSGKSTESIRPLVQADLLRDGKVIDSGEVLNDVVISKDAKTTILTVDIIIDGDLLSRVRSDGYLIATPTGSTGYSLSSGGGLLHPSVNAMILRPISAHSLTVRSVIVPQKMTVEIAVSDFEGPVYLIRDGLLSLEVKPEDRIRVQLSETCLRMVGSDKSWPDILRAKLNMS